MVEDFVFGRMIGVGRRLCVILSCLLLLWLLTKKPWWQMCGSPREGGGGGGGGGGLEWFVWCGWVGRDLSPTFSSPFNDWEVEEVQCLLQGKKVLPNQEDQMLLKEAIDGTFSVKLLYKMLDGTRAINYFSSRAYLEFLGSL